MRHLLNLRVQLQDRRTRVFKAGYRAYGHELRFMLDFLNDNPFTCALLDSLGAQTSIDFEQWAQQQPVRPEFYEFANLPETEGARAKICHDILKRCISDENGSGWQRWPHLFSSESKPDPILCDFTEAVVDPLVNYLHDRIDDGDNVLYLIERFKMQIEWFKKDELYSQYRNDTSKGEKNLDQELRAYLFDGGIDFPFSEPNSPSGKADIVALLGTSDPLVLEVKVFDPSTSKTKANLQSGFNQVLRYADDYNQGVGYLVIFNCSENQLAVVTSEESEPEFPARIEHASKTIFAITIDVNPNSLSASQENPATRQVISVEELIHQTSST